MAPPRLLAAVPAVLLAGCLGLAGSGVADAATFRVPEDAPTIQAAIDLAVAGDSVLVGPGTWSDTEIRWTVVNGNPGFSQSAGFLKAGLTVIGTAGAEQTMVDGGTPTTASVQTFLLQNADTELVTRLEGLTITGGGQGLMADGPHRIEVSHCAFVSNSNSGARVLNGTDLYLSDSLFDENNQSGEGGGSRAAVKSWLGASAEMRGCTFQRNVLGAVNLNESPRVVIEDCLVQDHQDWGGGAIVDCPNVIVRNSQFLRNSTADGGGAMVFVGCTGTVEFNTFAYDSAAVITGGWGGALFVGSGNHVRIQNNTFHGCHAKWGGSALFLGQDDAGFLGNVISGSTGKPALLKTGGPSSSLSGCNVLWDNAGGDYAQEWTPAPTDLPADPQFCNPDAGDYTVSSASPCLPENHPFGCGPIGAHGEGCGAVSVEDRTWGEIKCLYHGRDPR